jgi:cell wall-associated NlpC family hydrolase
MPNHRRSRALLAYIFAVPVVITVYAGIVGARVWAALRPRVATFLGATVVGSIYAGEAWRRAPATPMRVAASLALAVVLVAPAVAPVPVAAAQDPAEAVIDAAREYLGSDFRMGAEGPKVFDCSGLIYRIFADIGELPRISGMRLGATAYMRWFVARGRFSKHEEDAQRGDLVVWDDGHHIGVYIGNGKAISALVNPWGVSVHGLHAIHMKVTQFLLVNWGRNDGGGGDNGGGDNGGGDNNNPPPDDPPADDPPADNPPADNPGNGDSDGSTGSTPGDNSGGDNGGGNNGGGDNNNNPPPQDNPPQDNPPADDPPAPAPQTGLAQVRNQSGVLPADNSAARPDGSNGMVIATLNLRETADTSSRIVGWVGSGAYVRVIGQAFSPQGYLYFNVETDGGSSGWVYSRWVLQTPN